MSGYRLGVDLGTTWTAAAVARPGGGGAEMVGLGNRTAVVPSLVLVKADGEVLVGEAAARRGAMEPERLAREFKRRLGDPAPVLVGGSPWSADGLTGLLLRRVVDQVAALEGGPPDALAVAHPANWGEFKQDLLRQAVARADLDVPADRVVLVTEPEAAAAHYAAQRRVAPGSVVAVYDLGGGTFDVAVLRKTATGWEILGEPQGVERLGGIDVDAAVFGHVVAALGLDVDRVPAVALARLRADCVEAKELLSSDTAVTVPATVDGRHREVRLTRSELEAMVRGPLAATTTALRQALRSAGVAPDAVDAVLLVGGSSRIPLVGQLVGLELARPITIDAHPKHAVALGAALHAARLPSLSAPAAASAPAPVPAPVPVSVPSAAVRSSVPVAQGPAALAPPPSPPPPVQLPPSPLTPNPPAARGARSPLRGQVRGAIAGAGVVAVVVVGALLLRGDDDPGATPPATTTVAPTAQIPEFTDDFDGTPGEGDRLMAWLDEHRNEPIHLDLTFTGEPSGTDSPVLPAGCDRCDDYVLHVSTDGDPPFHQSRGRTRLEGYFLHSTVEGPFQGIMSVDLDPISAADAVGR